MSVSVFDLFSIGVGPSSSHTVGPMRAAYRFIEALQREGKLLSCQRLVIDLYGSLAWTGKGHQTDVAILLGLEGEQPHLVDPATIPARMAHIRQQGKLQLGGAHSIAFSEEGDLLFHKDRQLPYHPNGMRFTAYGPSGAIVKEQVYYSIGGGFVVEHGASLEASAEQHEKEVPFAFESCKELQALCSQQGCAISELIRRNERVYRSDELIRSGVLTIWKTMYDCMERGCEEEGVLPGGLEVQRRAKAIREQLLARQSSGEQRPTDPFEWVSLWALAVNEENAACGRVVTAPTNGSAGVIPAVIRYYLEFVPGANEEGVVDFFLTATAIGILYKKGASISAAEMGCMGEVGVACSMAAAGLTAVMGGTNAQIETAAEIGMEHNLGLTCDPIMGLVQIPCIERNAMGAWMAICAALLSMSRRTPPRVSFDEVVAAMRETGNNMQAIYKETARGGLAVSVAGAAVNVPEC